MRIENRTKRKLVGWNVTGVRGNAANLDDLDRPFDTVKRERGKIDVLFASAGTGETVKLANRRKIIGSSGRT